MSVVDELNNMARTAIELSYITAREFARIKKMLPQAPEISGTLSNNYYYIPVIIHHPRSVSVSIIEIYGNNKLEYKISGDIAEFRLKPSGLIFITHPVLFDSFNEVLDIYGIKSKGCCEKIVYQCKNVGDMAYSDTILLKASKSVYSKIRNTSVIASSTKIIANDNNVNVLDDSVYYIPPRILTGKNVLFDAYITLCVTSQMASLMYSAVKNIENMYSMRAQKLSI